MTTRIKNQLTLQLLRRRTLKVEIDVERDHGRIYPILLVDGKRIGHPVDDKVYPDSVRVVDVTFSDGSQETVADHNLPYYKDQSPVYWENGQRRYRIVDVYPKKLYLKRIYLVDYAKMIYFKEAWQGLQIGATVAKIEEHTFERRGRWVTNREIKIPLTRPTGQAWRKHDKIRFLQPIKAQNWSLMLDSVVGCYFDDFSSVQKTRARVRTYKLRKKHATRIARVQSQCFDKGLYDQSLDVDIGVGERMLFIGTKNNRVVYVADSPNHGHALYLFREKGPAQRWVNGQIDFRTARSLAKECIMHRGLWKVRADHALARP